MTKKFLDELVEISFDGANINEKTIHHIAPKLKRRELKAYIRKLKNQILKHTVTITTPYDLKENSKTQFQNVFSTKLVAFETDPLLLFGLKIVNNDIVYDSTLKGEFNRIANSVRE